MLHIQDSEVWRVLTTTSDVGNVTQGHWLPDHRVLLISGAQRFQAFDVSPPPPPPFVWCADGNDNLSRGGGARVGGTPRGRSSACEQRDNCSTLTHQHYVSPVVWKGNVTNLSLKPENQWEVPTSTPTEHVWQPPLQQPQRANTLTGTYR